MITDLSEIDISHLVFKDLAVLGDVHCDIAWWNGVDAEKLDWLDIAHEFWGWKVDIFIKNYEWCWHILRTFLWSSLHFDSLDFETRSSNALMSLEVETLVLHIRIICRVRRFIITAWIDRTSLSIQILLSIRLCFFLILFAWIFFFDFTVSIFLMQVVPFQIVLRLYAQQLIVR